jgi:GGDEF domain-containing protein
LPLPFLPYLFVLAGQGLGWGFNTVMAFIAILLGINCVAQPAAASLLFSIAAGAILIGLVLNSYNLAYLDELTNLHSRRALEQQLLALGKRYSIAMVDIDHFKKPNDTCGHDVGDQVLRMVAAQLAR